MAGSPLAPAHRLLEDAVSAVAAEASPGACDDVLLSVLTVCEGATRRLDQVMVTTLAGLDRRGVFAERGYRSTVTALADLLGWERSQARRRVLAAEQVCPRTGLHGAQNPPRLAATAEVFTQGMLGLRHIEVIAKALGTTAAGRLSPSVWAAAEAELATKATLYTPTELAEYATALVTTLDQDGPEPDDTAPPPVNELHLHPNKGGAGGTLKGRFDDAALYDAIATLVDTKAKPTSAEDHRPTGQRQAEALAEACGWVLDHGQDVPESGGFRPHLNVIIGLEDLEHRARSAMLDFGGTLSPEALRMLACDCSVVPVVMNGTGQPLDVGRATRTIPDGLRRAVAARDRGCARPGCARPASWCDVHHIHPWECGGQTALSNCVMLCKACHRLMHSGSGWTVRITDGIPEFIPPPWVDRHQQPRRRPLPHLVSGP